MKMLLLATALSMSAGAAEAASQPFIGEVITVANPFCPSGFSPMNGQLLAISENETLFQLIGTTYGGDGQTTFALPTAKPVFTADGGVAFLQCISLYGVFPTRD